MRAGVSHSALHSVGALTTMRSCRPRTALARTFPQLRHHFAQCPLRRGLASGGPLESRSVFVFCLAEGTGCDLYLSAAFLGITPRIHQLALIRRAFNTHVSWRVRHVRVARTLPLCFGARLLPLRMFGPHSSVKLGLGLLASLAYVVVRLHRDLHLDARLLLLERPLIR